MVISELPQATIGELCSRLRLSAEQEEDYLGVSVYRQALLFLDHLVANRHPLPDELRVDGEGDEVTFEWLEDGKWVKDAVVRRTNIQVAWVGDDGEIETDDMGSFPEFNHRFAEKL